jgi:light-regulated signal transduction histidine kinase (bacteriophytochrome)
MMNDIKKEYDQFAYIVSHDLSAPLRQIKGFMDIFMEDCEVLTKSQQQSKDMMLKAVHSAEEMIDGLLRISRLNTYEISKKSLNLSAVLNDITYHYTNVSIETKYIPAQINADEYIVKSVITEIIDNAIKFHSPDRPIQIVVSGQYDKKADQYSINISDNGIGIDPEYIDRAFQPLQQLHPKQLYTGSGIGLTLCKKMMKLHGGQIFIHQNKDNGINVCVSF